MLTAAVVRAFDPSVTLAVHCGNGFDPGFSPLWKHAIEPLGCFVSGAKGWRYATARVHHDSRRCGGGMAAGGARAAARADAAHWRAHWRRGRGRTFRSASRRSCRCWRNWAGPTAATCGSIYRGRRAIPTPFANTRLNWSRSVPDVIFAVGSSTMGPLLQATRTVPIVFAIVPDPVGSGFVASLSRPGGNATGFVQFEYRFEREMAGTAQRDRARHDASGGPLGSRHSPRYRPVRRHPGRGALGRPGVSPVNVATRAISSATSPHSHAWAEWRHDRDASTLAAIHRDLIIALAARHRLPAVYATRICRRRRPDLLRDRLPTRTGGPPATSIASLRARSRPICRYRRRQSMKSLSTSKPPRRSAFKFRRPCSPAPTR